MTLNLVVQPLHILVGIGLLIYTLGYSALVGLAVSSHLEVGREYYSDVSLQILVLATPLQGERFSP